MGRIIIDVKQSVCVSGGGGGYTIKPDDFIFCTPSLVDSIPVEFCVVDPPFVSSHVHCCQKKKCCLVRGYNKQYKNILLVILEVFLGFIVVERFSGIISRAL